MISLWHMMLNHIWMILAVCVLFAGLGNVILDWFTWKFGMPYIEITHIRRMK